MIRIFYGNDRIKAREMAERLLGADYEVIEAENLTRNDMESIFKGVSLFGADRKILIKGLSENKECWEALGNYIETTHLVVLLENSFDKRTTNNKALAASKLVELKEFKLPEQLDRFASFAPFDAAFKNGDAKRALAECDKLQKAGTEAFPLIATMSTQVLKLLNNGKNVKAVAATKILAQVDMDTKSTGMDAWDLVRIALIKIAAL